MRVVLCLTMLLGWVFLSGAASPEIAIEPDPRVDLLATVFCLADNFEYRGDDPTTLYGQAFRNKFEPFKNHPVVKMAAEFRYNYGVSYNAVAGYALCLDSMTTLNLLPGSLETLDKRWPRDKLSEFTAALQDFAKTTDFMTFYNDNLSQYNDDIKFYRELVTYSDCGQWVARFFRGVPIRQSIVPAMLVRGGYGFSEMREGVLYCNPVLGFAAKTRFFDKLNEQQKIDCSSFLIHELTHPAVNLTLDKYYPQLAETAKIAFAPVKRKMLRQAYGDAETLMYETFNRAVNAVYLADRFGDKAAQRKLAEENDNGFELVPVVYEAICEARKKDGNDWSFEQSFPQLVAAVNRQEVKTMIEAAARQRLEKLPQIVSVTPANESENVDPATTVITVVFDRPMLDKSWSVCQKSEDGFPEIKKISYDKTCTVLTIEAVLKPEHDYLMDFNSGRYRGFVSSDMQPLEDYSYTFTTGKAKTATP